MKTYLVDIDVTTRWTVEVCACDEDEALQIAEEMSSCKIEQSGDFKDRVTTEITNVEEITNVD